MARVSSFFKATKTIPIEKLIPINNFNYEQFHVKNARTAALPTPSSETDINQCPDSSSEQLSVIESDIRSISMNHVKMMVNLY